MGEFCSAFPSGKRKAGPLVLKLGTLFILVLIVLVALYRPWQSAPWSHAAGTQPDSLSSNASSLSTLHVHKNQILDASGHPLLLRGTQIESAFTFANTWLHNGNPFKVLNPTIFAAIRGWNMNALRIPISNWIYQTSNYLTDLDTVISQANKAGLYVVLDDHDNDQSGSPYGTGADVPKAENLSFWQNIATRYKNNPGLLFDLLNEPKQPDWNTWLHGGGKVTGSTGKTATILGMQNLVNAIRTAGANQLIIAEAPPGSNGFDGIGNDLIQDPNIVYSVHHYFNDAKDNRNRLPSGWDLKFGNLSVAHPMYIGEWAFIPNANHPVFCRNITTPKAEQLVSNFLTYMQQHQVSWTAWSYSPYHLIQDYTHFSPTALTTPWHCGNTASHAGMGDIVKQYLAS